MHYYLELTMPELAETLGIPLGTAQSRLARALVALRRAMGNGSDLNDAIVRQGQIA